MISSPGHQPEGTPKLDSNVAVVQRFLTLLGETDSTHTVGVEDATSAQHLLHPDCVFLNPMLHPDRGLFDPSLLPADGVLRGPASIVRDLELISAHWDVQIKDPRFYDVNGEFVLFTAVAVATGKVTGRSNESAFFEIFWVADGRITKIQTTNDTKAFWDLLPEG